MSARPGQLVFPALAGAPARISLGSLGMLDLDAASLFALPAVDLRTSCRQTFSIPVPNLPILRGRPVYWQAYVVDFALPSETRLTNWTVDTIR